MPSSVPGRQIAGFLFASAAGTLLHFLFDITGQSLPAALISAVNESIWEHMKLLFYPMVLFAWLERRSAGKQETGFWCRKLKSILLGLTLIPVVYYKHLPNLKRIMENREARISWLWNAEAEEKRLEGRFDEQEWKKIYRKANRK